MSAPLSRYVTLICLISTCALAQNAASGELPPAQLQWLGERIFSNECAGRPACLTAWNPGEEFPSLGIGHFIWFAEGQQAPFTETFPALLAFMRSRGLRLPDWLDGPDPEAPWPNREAFLADLDSPRMTALRDLLLSNLELQTAFIVQRFQQARDRVTAAAAPSTRPMVAANFDALAAADPPYGLYALIDYVHFKGEGLAPGERYQGQGWGLLQVLQAMAPDSDDPLAAFRQAAAEVLRRRVANAPPARAEERWLQGWLNRLDTYRRPHPQSSRE